MAAVYVPCEVCGKPTRSRYKVCYPRKGGGKCKAEHRKRWRLENLRRIAEEQGWICGWCENPLPRSLNGVHEDHIIPRINGGPLRPRWNRQAVHGGCNQSKGNVITAEARRLAKEHGVELLNSQRQRYEPRRYDHPGAYFPWHG